MQLDVIIELNLLHEGGLKGARRRFDELWTQEALGPEPEEAANTYIACRLSMREIQRLIHADETRLESAGGRSIACGQTFR